MRRFADALFVLFLFALLYNVVAGMLAHGVHIRHWSYSYEEPLPPESMQRVAFEATVVNERRYPVFIFELEASFGDVAMDRFVQGERRAPVREWLEPGEEAVVRGEWVFDTAGLPEGDALHVNDHVDWKANKFPFN